MCAKEEEISSLPEVCHEETAFEAFGVTKRITKGDLSLVPGQKKNLSLKRDWEDTIVASLHWNIQRHRSVQTQQLYKELDAGNGRRASGTQRR